jgi:hypothetical protein
MLMRLEYRPPYRPNWQFADARETNEDVLYNDALGSIHLADSTGMDEELETGDAKEWNFQTYED